MKNEEFRLTIDLARLSSSLSNLCQVDFDDTRLYQARILIREVISMIDAKINIEDEE